MAVGGGADSFYYFGRTGAANPADAFAGGGGVDSVAGTACCGRRGNIRSANCRHNVGERRSTHLHLQRWGFSSLCGINRGDTHLAGRYRGGPINSLHPFSLTIFPASLATNHQAQGTALVCSPGAITWDREATRANGSPTKLPYFPPLRRNRGHALHFMSRETSATGCLSPPKKTRVAGVCPRPPSRPQEACPPIISR